MNLNYLKRGLYCTIRYIADELDNTWALSRESFTVPYFLKCDEDAKDFKEKAKQNFRMAFQKDISNII